MSFINSRDITSDTWKRIIGNKVTAPNPPRGKRAKYGAKPCVVDGLRFDSQAEASYYGTIKLLHQVGEILWFCRQPRFVIEGGEYVADFIVMYSDGRISVIDVKGFKTPQYRQKRRQMKERYGIEIQEIR